MGAELAASRREDTGEIEEVGLPVSGAAHLAQAFDVPDHLVDGGKAQARHHTAELLGNEQHEPLDMLGLAGKAVAQAAVLCGDTCWAGVLLAIALHEASHGDERHGGEAKFLGTQ